MSAKAKKQVGFTIVELLVVIVVVGILAAISVVAYTGIQERARDAQRSQDMAAIKKALLMYNATHAGVPTVYTFGGNITAGWHLSSGANWLSFLEGEYGKMPVDPINTGTEDPTATAAGYEWVYFYVCRSTPTPRVELGYFSGQTKLRKPEYIPVDRCL